ncbi:MAG: hypothetical protein ACYC1K_01570 [Minisyncoccota bacterium]
MNLKEILLLVVVVMIGTVLLLFAPDVHRFEKGGSHRAIIDSSNSI